MPSNSFIIICKSMVYARSHTDLRTGRSFRVTTRNFLAKSDFTFNFENGWKLTQAPDRADNTAVANTLAGQLQTILAAAEGAGPFKLPATNTVHAPQLRVILFRPIFDKQGYIESFQEVGAPETK
jgi:hypothetical protein